MEIPHSNHKRFYDRVIQEADIADWMLLWPGRHFNDYLAFFRVCVEDLPLEACDDIDITPAQSMSIVYDLWKLNGFRTEAGLPIIAAKSWEGEYLKLDLW